MQPKRENTIGIRLCRQQHLLRKMLVCFFVLILLGMNRPSNTQGAELCGNGIVETGEECDDGGTSAGDGCSSDCLVEDGWTCGSEPSICISDVLHPPPYPTSDYIVGIDWDLSTHVTAAPGSDLWPVTWASDGNLYTSWGDGGGFGGTNSDGRVSLGFARIEGLPENFQGINIWGGKDPENSAQFDGKSPAIISVSGILYGWLNTQIGSLPDTKLIWSDNLGATWHTSEWSFPGEDGLSPSGFMNAGKDNADAKDNYVYAYGSNKLSEELGLADKVYLIRIPKDQIENRASYEFLSGFDVNSSPTWSADVNDRAPVFYDPNGVGSGGLATVDYNPAIDRYIFTVAHRAPGVVNSPGGRLGVFEGPNPWGPWSTVAYYDNWLDAGDDYEGLGWTFPGKWISTDGLTMWCVFSCWGCNSAFDDKFNLIKATLTLSSSEDADPPDPDPMTWAIEPYATGSNSIAMEAVTASDENGVEYYFKEISGNQGGSDSGWQTSATYEDTGLRPSTTYTYTVRVRDKSSSRNETASSFPASATTEPPDPVQNDSTCFVEIVWNTCKSGFMCLDAY